MKRDPFAPADVGDIVQMSHYRVGVVEKLVYDTAVIRLMFGEQIYTDTIYVSEEHDSESGLICENRFRLMKFIRPESADD
jgi:hypothetical protein